MTALLREHPSDAPVRTPFRRPRTRTRLVVPPRRPCAALRCRPGTAGPHGHHAFCQPERSPACPGARGPGLHRGMKVPMFSAAPQQAPPSRPQRTPQPGSEGGERRRAPSGLFEPAQLVQSFPEALRKLHPRVLVRNPDARPAAPQPHVVRPRRARPALRGHQAHRPADLRGARAWLNRAPPPWSARSVKGAYVHVRTVLGNSCRACPRCAGRLRWDT